MHPAHRVIVLGFIVLSGFLARAATYRAPLLDHHAWRQADTAAISRNFYREHFNVLYPQVDQRGAQEHGYVETGMEGLAFLVACISLAMGFHHETGRLVSAFLFVGSCLLVASFVRRRYGDEHALVAAFLYAFGFPLLLFIERAFMNEALLIFLSLACFAATDHYLRRPGALPLTALTIASSALAVIKLPYVIAWTGILGLFLERYGRSTLRQPALWAVAALNVAAAAAWYIHVHQLAASTGLSFGMTDKLFDVGTVFSIEFPRRLVVRFAKDILGPLPLVAVGVGCWLALRQRRWFETLGVAGYIAYLVLVARGNFHHDYYQLALMPIAPVLASVGVIHAVDRLASPERRDQWLAVFLGVAMVCTFVRHVSAHSWYEYSYEEVTLCETLRALSAPGDRVVFVAYNDPKIMFCADRKGWLLLARNGAGLTDAIRQGARLAIVSHAADESVREMLRRQASRPVFTTSAFHVFSLPQPTISAAAPQKEPGAFPAPKEYPVPCSDVGFDSQCVAGGVGEPCDPATTGPQRDPFESTSRPS